MYTVRVQRESGESMKKSLVKTYYGNIHTVAGIALVLFKGVIY